MQEFKKNVWGNIEDICVEYHNDDLDNEMKKNIFMKLFDQINEKINFINENKSEIFSFIEEKATVPAVYNINEKISKNGNYKLANKKIINNLITKEDVEKSYQIGSISVYILDDDDFYVDIDIYSENPPYFGDNCISLMITKDNDLSFEGING